MRRKRKQSQKLTLKMHKHTMKHIVIALGVLMLALAPLGVDAKPVVRTGERVSVESDQTVDGDFYAMGGTISSSGIIAGDMFAAGGIVTLNGAVEDDFAALGGIINLHAPVGDDVRLVGEELVVGESIAGDLVVFGNSLQVLSTAEIGGDILFFGREMEFNGVVKGDVVAHAERVRLDGAIEGNAQIEAARGATLGERSHITGDLVYASNVELTRAQGAVVVGDIQKKALDLGPDGSSFNIGLFLAFLFSALVLLFLLRGRGEKFVKESLKGFGVRGLIGLGALILTPFVGVLLLVSVLGGVLGVFLIALYIALLLLAFAGMGIFAGALCARVVKKEYIVSWQWTVLGVLILQVLAFVPILGQFALLLLFFVVFGSILYWIYSTIR